MPKSLLLPKDYIDPVTRSIIFYALKPYENPNTEEAINPNIKWDLRKAWNAGEDVIAQSRWQAKDTLGVREYEFAADTDAELESANIIIAALIAYQTMNPDEPVAIRRIEHTKGGEMVIVISAAAADALKKLIPLFGGAAHASEKKAA